MPVQATDIALFLISFAACVYCIVLSRRLRVLQNTKDGLGATIMALSESIAAMSTTTQETRKHAGELAARLAHLLQEANRTSLQIEGAIREIEIRHARSVEESRATGAELEALVRRLLEESKSSIGEMTTLTRQMRMLTEGTTETILEAIHRAAESQALPKSRMVPHHDS